MLPCSMSELIIRTWFQDKLNPNHQLRRTPNKVLCTLEEWESESVPSPCRGWYVYRLEGGCLLLPTKSMTPSWGSCLGMEQQQMFSLISGLGLWSPQDSSSVLIHAASMPGKMEGDKQHSCLAHAGFHPGHSMSPIISLLQPQEAKATLF